MIRNIRYIRIIEKLIIWNSLLCVVLKCIVIKYLVNRNNTLKKSAVEQNGVAVSKKMSSLI